MKKALILLFLFMAFVANANEYYKAKIQLLSGDVKEGYAELPSNRILDGAIKFKESEKGKTTKFKNDDIDIILYTTEAGKYLFERRNTRIAIKSFGKEREKTYKSKSWLLVRFYDPLITYYWIGQTYLIDEEGDMVARTVDTSGTWADISLFYRRPGEDAPTLMASFSSITIIGAEKKFRKWAMLYFGEDNEIGQRIENKEFKIENMLELAKAYVAYKKKADGVNTIQE
ncbi:hypothetical protein E0W68_01525 [Flavobacterium salilacus subsp. salilacus]|uniref:hypothetical protein n=1 Tax=Flavobacterium TaxID=237 RepID=UPI001074E542|nr:MULTISPECIES: hypothetical protein [Flavobacterium]KAF2519934.1 hypothetical protein E0W68_01525 [Flavobacterium salilacus subsp. salilacus]MBE1614155.1 hypothetical protein [Flavobacterium sp. SaA2.13]